MIAKILLIILIVVSISCCQTFVPGHVVWDQYGYTNIVGEPIDTVFICFDVYYGPDTTGSPYQLLGTTAAPDTFYTLIHHAELYRDQTLYFFLRARNINPLDPGVSVPSDTTNGNFFPVIVPKTLYNIGVIEVPTTN